MQTRAGAILHVPPISFRLRSFPSVSCASPPVADPRDLLAPCLQNLRPFPPSFSPSSPRSQDWLAPQQYRQALCHVLFEQLSVPSVLFVSSTEALLYTSGESTGIMVDVGDAETRVMPIYEGCVPSP